MPETTGEVSYSTISVPIEKWSDARRGMDLEEVWHHGRAVETALKANVLLKMAEETVVPVDDISIEWSVVASVKGVTVPAEYLEGVTGPEDLEKRIQEFQAHAQAGLAKSPGWAADLRFHVPIGPLVEK